MSDPNEPIEILVTELDHLCFSHGFVEGEINETDVRLCISIHALQTLFEFACRSGVIIPDSGIFYRRGGQLRRYKRAKDKANAT